MGANMSRCFTTAEDADRWVALQVQQAARWNLQKTADLGNTPIVRVPVIGPDGTPAEFAVDLEPAKSVEDRIFQTLARSRRRGYREDRSRRRQPAIVRSLRFD